MTLRVKDRIIRVEIIEPSIIHVQKYLPGQPPGNIPDFVTVLKPENVKWKTTEEKDRVIIETPAVSIIVNREGLLRYYDTTGRKLLSESSRFTYIQREGIEDFAISQSFDAGDEGLYGLGQFQSGIMNWKNVPVRLKQSNQEIAIPFLVSTNHYGIYWHNYSITDFNHPEHEILFSQVANEEENIRSASLIPEKSGVYSFMAVSENPVKNRKRGPVMVTIDADTIIHYNTVWVPDCFSGRKYLEAGRSYRIVFQNTRSQEAGRLLYNEPDFNQTVFSSKYGRGIDYYFIAGKDPAGVMAGYRRLTGRAPLLPKWAYGFWQCRERYHNQKELLENARIYREKKIPVDNIVQDWFYWPKGEIGPEWNRRKYPDPAVMVDELTRMHLHLMVSVWPHVQNKKLLERYHLTGCQLGTTGYLDFYDPVVREHFYRMVSDSMFHIGVSAIWLDGTEPETKPADTTCTAAGAFGTVANAYSLLVSRAIYEGKRKEYPRKRVFNLTRSSYAGQQRYGAASWSGDVAATWEQLREQIPAALNFMMAGIPYWTNDIGGFFRDRHSLNPMFDDQYTNPEYRELLIRWFQFGIFNPIFRIHGYQSKTEIWHYGKTFEKIARKYIDLRYRLLPYIYSEAWKITARNGLMMRPLVYDFPDDKKTWNIDDQFMFGDEIMACPVTVYGTRSRKVYLPEGVWYDFHTNEKNTGKRTITAAAPPDVIPLFIRAGSVLPMGPVIEYSTQPTQEPLHIRIYPGADGTYDLYLDDGLTHDYEDGNWSAIHFRYSDSHKSLTVTRQGGAFADLQKHPMVMIIETAGYDHTRKVVFTGKPVNVSF